MRVVAACSVLLVGAFSTAFVTPSRRSSRQTTLKDALDATSAVAAPEEDVTTSTNSYTLNESAFLKTMESDMDGLVPPPPATAPAAATSMDAYERAAARLEGLARASMAAHPPVDKAEIEAIAKQNAQKATGGGPTTVFAILGIALAAATVAQNPVLVEEIKAVHALPPFDGLSMPSLDAFDSELLDQMTAQANAMKDAFVEQASQVKENFLQVDGFKSAAGASLESIKEAFEAQKTNLQPSVYLSDIETFLRDTLDSTTSVLQSAVEDTSTFLQEIAATLRAQIPLYTKAVQDTVAVQTADAQSALFNLQSSLQSSLEDVQVQLPAYSKALQDTVAVQTADAQSAMLDLQSSMETSLHDAQVQVPGYTKALQDTISVQTADAQSAMLNLQSALETSLHDAQVQVPVYTKALQDTISVQTADAQSAMLNLQSSLETSLHDAQVQVPVYTKELQDTISVQTADAQSAMLHLQSSLEASLEDVQQQLPGVVNIVQQTVDSQVGGLKESVNALQTLVDAQATGFQDSLPGKVESFSTDVVTQLAAVQQSMRQQADVVIPAFQVDEIMNRATDALSLDAVADTFTSAQAWNFPKGIADQASSTLSNRLGAIQLPTNLAMIDLPSVVKEVEDVVTKQQFAVPQFTFDDTSMVATRDLTNLDIYSASSADIEHFFNSH